ncbi:MAG: slipin family protein [Lentisphaeria bacterium]|nr:slipin family protein [Lentisphaeria bacterium]NQZ67643.1 slipin family protein [Lentisphaeria bacterium]
MIKRYHINYNERGVKIVNGEVKRLLGPGTHWLIGSRIRVMKLSLRQIILHGEIIEDMANSQLGLDELSYLDIPDTQRALIWVSGRLHQILEPGQYAYWTQIHRLRVELVDISQGLFEHEDLQTIMRSPQSTSQLTELPVVEGHVAMVYKHGKIIKVLEAGTYAYWNKSGIKSLQIELREQMLDVSGQEIISADKVSLRINAILSYRVNDPLKAVSTVQDFVQTLYRDVQMALRSIVGTLELDQLLASKTALAEQLMDSTAEKAKTMGLLITRIGVKDIILPGEMKTLLNQVTEARKAAEAAVIKRREETAEMRSQANTAKFLEDNPMLLKLKEMEIMDKVAEKASLTIVTGEKSVIEHISHLI